MICGAGAWPLAAATVALLMTFHLGSVGAATSCPRPARPDRNYVHINSFAENPPDRAIDVSAERCAWGIGLAIPAVGTGTAFIVGNRREVMTNLHVVDRACTGNRTFRFSHGYERGQALSVETATVVATGDYCAMLARGHHDYSGDWAVAVLDRDPAAVEHTATSTDTKPLQPRSGGDWPSNAGHYYFLLGYSMSFRAGRQPYRSAPCRLARIFSPSVVEHSCDASHRASGAPIIETDRRGNCVLAALHVGEIASASGRPVYRDDINANIAVLADRFAPAVVQVARDLQRGLSAAQIAADLTARHPQRKR